MEFPQFFYFINRYKKRIVSILLKMNRNEYEDKEKNNFSSWTVNRKNWKKNRIFFNLVFKKTIIPIYFLRVMERRKKIDLNLIFAWKTLKFSNLCTTLVLEKKNLKYNTKFSCRESLFSRTFLKIFFVEKISGCRCCCNENNLQEPIWWDNQWKIRILFF